MKNLRSLRESRKISQQKLADHLDLAQSQIQSYEAGTYEPDISTLNAMANFFETTIDYIVGRTDVSRRIEPVEAYELNEAEQELVEQYRKLQPNQRKSLSMFIETLAGE